jgi:hypothetical protein
MVDDDGDVRFVGIEHEIEDASDLVELVVWSLREDGRMTCCWWEQILVPWRDVKNLAEMDNPSPAGPGAASFQEADS